MNPGDLVRVQGYEPIPVVGIRRANARSAGVSLERGLVAVVVAVEPADIHGRQDIGILVRDELIWVGRGFLKPMQPAADCGITG